MTTIGPAAAARVTALVADELAGPIDPAVRAMAAALAERYGASARAVLFYGSCLRTADLDGQMLDFYLIVSDYRAAYGKRWLAIANRLLPPNVFPFTHGGLASKYAVLSERDLATLCGPKASTVSVWARFAQAARLAWHADAAAADRTIAAVAQAAPTLLTLARPTMTAATATAGADPLAVWRAAFALTYRAELRAERDDRSGSIVDGDPDRYRRFGHAILDGEAEPASPDERRRAMAMWRGLQRRGKLVTVARLIKASATFAGGIDYLAWKINRHAGTQIIIRPWQRRHPLLAAVMLVPRLMRAGAVR